MNSIGIKNDNSLLIIKKLYRAFEATSTFKGVDVHRSASGAQRVPRTCRRPMPAGIRQNVVLNYNPQEDPAQPAS